MGLDSKTKELLEKGKAKAKVRLAIVKEYLKGIGTKEHKDIVNAGNAKKKAREEIVRKYLAMQS